MRIEQWSVDVMSGDDRVDMVGEDVHEDTDERDQRYDRAYQHDGMQACHKADALCGK